MRSSVSVVKIFLLCVFVIACFCGTSLAAAANCWWLFAAVEGSLSVNSLGEPRITSQCPNGILSYLVIDSDGNDAYFTSLHQGDLYFTPKVTGLAPEKIRYTSVTVDVLCNGTETVCSNAPVMFVVRGEKSTTSTESPSSSEPPSSEPPSTEPPSPSYPPQIPSCSSVYNFTASPGDLLEATLELSPEDKALCNGTQKSFLYSLSSFPFYDEDFSFVSGENEGHIDYMAPLSANVGEEDGFDYTLSCSDEAEEITVELCKGHVSIELVSLPEQGENNSDTGKDDANESGDNGDDTPEEKDEVFASCPGVFNFTFYKNSNGEIVSSSSSILNLFARATTTQTGFCIRGVYNSSSLVSSPIHGSLTSFDPASGVFSYEPPTSEVMSTLTSNVMDVFNFTLTCADEVSSTGDNTDYQPLRCTGTAVLLAEAAPDPDAIYSLHDSTMMCRGSCYKNENGGRQDNHEVGDMDFSFTSAGGLKIKAYGAIDGLSAHFVTFQPITDNDTTLDAANLFDNRMLSFDVRCLNKQAAYGTIENMWQSSSNTTWDGELNLASENYRLGENYFQKFNGNHQLCDVYRENPCKLAPLYTPESPLDFLRNAADDPSFSPNPISWKVFIRDCDVTWVGTASAESLRAMLKPDGSPVFSLINGTELVGTIYFRTVKPKFHTGNETQLEHSEKAYRLVLSLGNHLVVEAIPLPLTSSIPSQSLVHLGADVQYAAGQDPVTHERLYAYALLLYPYRIVELADDDTSIVNVNTSELSVTSITLLNSSWFSPNPWECPQCTGSRMTCIGTGEGLYTDCGTTEGLLTMGWLLPNTQIFTDDSMYSHSDGEGTGNENGADVLFPSTSFENENYYNISVAARVNGVGTAWSADQAPDGEYYLEIGLSNGQRFVLLVNQTDYISQINTKYLHPVLCRSSSYSPVPDELGKSLPINPYEAANISFTETQENAAPYYGYPAFISSRFQCDSLSSDDGQPPLDSLLTNEVVRVASLKAPVEVGNTTIQASMCAVENEQTYGLNDWVMVSFPGIYTLANLFHEKRESNTMESVSGGEDGSAPLNNTWTTVSLNFLLLSVSGRDALPGSVLDGQEGATHRRSIHFLLDGDRPPQQLVGDEVALMGVRPAEDGNFTYYSWQLDAPYLSYRRVEVENIANDDTVTTSSEGNATGVMTDPFHFSFIPGSLLHSTSLIRTSISLEVSFRFTKYQRQIKDEKQGVETVVKLSERNEGMRHYFAISRGISAAIRLDTDSYAPPLVTVHTGGLGRKTATTILVVLFLAILVALAASAYVEVTYKKNIHRAKHAPQDGVEGDQDVGAPQYSDQDMDFPRVRASSHSSVGHRRHSSATEKLAEGELKRGFETTFGVVGLEQQRIEEKEKEEQEKQKLKTSEKGNRDPTLQRRSRTFIGKEQERLPDGEVAQIIRKEEERVEDGEVANL